MKKGQKLIIVPYGAHGEETTLGDMQSLATGTRVRDYVKMHTCGSQTLVLILYQPSNFGQFFSGFLAEFHPLSTVSPEPQLVFPDFPDDSDKERIMDVIDGYFGDHDCIVIVADSKCDCIFTGFLDRVEDERQESDEENCSEGGLGNLDEWSCSSLGDIAVFEVVPSRTIVSMTTIV